MGADGIHIGTSGWSYDHWHGVLYPHGIPPRERLDYYLERFHTVELNSSYYHWPRDSSFVSWQRRMPEHFLLTVKAPRLLTHIQRLYKPEVWIERIERGLKLLESRWGILLVQTPPTLDFDPDRLDYFLAQAAPRMRIAVELRHPGWHREETYELLERHGAAYCIMSGANLPCVLRATASFVYVRLHGPDPEHLYGGSYSDDDLRWWADRIREWREQAREVFVYFNNDWEGNAVRNAETLKAFLGA